MFVNYVYFYPRPPGGGRPDTPNSTTQGSRFLSTPSGWRATVACVERAHNVEISIHALRVEGDSVNVTSQVTLFTFLSTPSGWRATLCSYSPCQFNSDFYPRPPGGGRPNKANGNGEAKYFYPRPPGGGRRRERLVTPDNFKEFLSTPSGWRATPEAFAFL